MMQRTNTNIHSNRQAQKPGMWYFAALPRLLVKAIIRTRLSQTGSHHHSTHLNMADNASFTGASSAKQAALNSFVQSTWRYWRYLYIPGTFLYMLGFLSLAYAVHLDRARPHERCKTQRVTSLLFYVLRHQLSLYGILVCTMWYALKDERPGSGIVRPDAHKNAAGSLKGYDFALDDGSGYFAEVHAVAANNPYAIRLIRSAITVTASALGVVALVTRYNYLDSECPFQRKCYVVSIVCIAIAFSRSFWYFLEYVRKIRTYIRDKRGLDRRMNPS